MTKKIVFKKEDGTCGIITPSPKALLGTTINSIAKKDVPLGLEYRIVDDIHIPSDRVFRNAWTDDNDTLTIDIDMPKARIIHMDNLRYLRDEKLKLLDIDQLKGADVSVIKKKLRDLPLNIDLSIAKTPEELKAIIPTIL